MGWNRETSPSNWLSTQDEHRGVSGRLPDTSQGWAVLRLSSSITDEEPSFSVLVLFLSCPVLSLSLSTPCHTSWHWASPLPQHLSSPAFLVSGGGGFWFLIRAHPPTWAFASLSLVFF